MISFRLLHSHLKALLNNDLKGTSIKGGFERAFATLFEQDVQTFIRTMFVNLDQLEKHLSKEEFQELESSSAFRVLLQQFQTFLYSLFSFDTDEGLMIRKYFIAYTKGDVPLFQDKLIQHMESLRESIQERAKHKRDNETESERHASSSRSGKDTHAEDADINSVNDKQPMAEVQLFAEHNILANGQQHSEQPESVYDTYLLEKVDRNTIPKSRDMSHRGGEIDQNADAGKCQVSCPLLDPSFDNITTKFSNQFLESENISLKKTVAQLQKDFSRMETHCVNMELKYQNQVLKNGQHGQTLNETSNEANIKREINVLEIRNIDLESSVARLLVENEKLNKENEHLKQTYKYLSDSIKKTSVQTKDHVDSLIVQLNCKSVENADLKARIQEKVFANTTLKNELRKINGTNVDTKLAKSSTLGKPVLQAHRNQSVVRQPTAFKSERPRFSKPRFASQVDVNNVLSKLVTPHYLPNFRESAPAKPHHLNAPSSSKNFKKESYGSSDIAHNHFLEEAKKKTQNRNWNLKPREMPSARTHHTPNACTPKPRSNNQTFRNWPASESSNVKLNVV
ncbi:hypothetical protein Tco_0462088, partial [Tanacetum coccineum]